MKKFGFTIFFVISPLFAQLPTLSTKPWIGFYAAHQTRDMQCLVKGNGYFQISLVEKGKAQSFTKSLDVLPLIYESDNGTMQVHRIDLKSLQSPDQPNGEAKKISYTGKASGGVEFLVNGEFDANKLSFSGKITNPGKTTVPLHFGFLTKMPDVYRNTTDAKKLEQKTLNDKFEVITSEGKKKKYEILAELDFTSPEVSNLKAVRIEMSPFGSNKFLFTSLGTGTFQMDKTGGKLRPADGLDILWQSPTQATDAASERMQIEIK